MIDLFGDIPDRAMTPEERRKLFGRRKDPTPSGHVYIPGTGPKGETCGTCAHLVRKTMAKTYLKCGLNEANWTGGRKSDVLARDPACRKWVGQ